MNFSWKGAELINFFKRARVKFSCPSNAAKKFQKSCKMKIFNETKLQNSTIPRAVGALKVIKNVDNLTFPAEWCKNHDDRTNIREVRLFYKCQKFQSLYLNNRELHSSPKLSLKSANRYIPTQNKILFHLICKCNHLAFVQYEKNRVEVEK